MTAAPTLRDVLRRAEVYGSQHPLRSPGVRGLRSSDQPGHCDLAANRVFYDLRTGQAWDLFFAGYYAFGGHGDPAPIPVGPVRGGEGVWTFSPRLFTEFLRDIEHGHAGSHSPPG